MKLINNQSTRLVTELSILIYKDIEEYKVTVYNIISEVYKFSNYLKTEKDMKFKVANEDLQLLEVKYC